MHLVPLVTFGGSRDHSIIIGAPTLKNSPWEGRPDISIVFKNSTGNWVTAVSSGTVSIDLYFIHSPGSCATSFALTERIVSFSGARLHRSDNQLTTHFCVVSM